MGRNNFPNSTTFGTITGRHSSVVAAITKGGINIVFFNPNDKISVLKQNHAFRSAGTAEVELPEIWAGSEIHCWIHFSTPENSLNSLSKYVGAIQL